MDIVRSALIVFPLCIVGWAAIAQEKSAKPERGRPKLQDIPEEQFEKALVESDLSLPTPSELFDALSKQTNVRWRTLYRDPLTHTLADRSKAAVWLGARISDCFMAIEARDTQQVRNLSKDMQAYARVLGLGEKTEPRIIRLDTFAESQSWPGARFELEALQGELAGNLRAMRDNDQAEMLLLGVWLRTLQIATQVVNTKDFEEMVICAGGIGLVDQLLVRIDHLSKKLRESDEIDAVTGQLERVARIWKAEKVLGGRKYSDEEVKETNVRITSVLSGLVGK